MPVLTLAQSEEALTQWGRTHAPAHIVAEPSWVALVDAPHAARLAMFVSEWSLWLAVEFLAEQQAGAATPWHAKVADLARKVGKQAVGREQGLREMALLQDASASRGERREALGGLARLLSDAADDLLGEPVPRGGSIISTQAAKSLWSLLPGHYRDNRQIAVELDRLVQSERLVFAGMEAALNATPAAPPATWTVVPLWRQALSREAVEALHRLHADKPLVGTLRGRPVPNHMRPALDRLAAQERDRRHERDIEVVGRQRGLVGACIEVNGVPLPAAGILLRHMAQGRVACGSPRTRQRIACAIDAWLSAPGSQACSRETLAALRLDAADWEQATQVARESGQRELATTLMCHSPFLHCDVSPRPRF